MVIFGELGLIPNQKTGFYCNDPKISNKFSGDTVSALTLALVTVIAPAIVVSSFKLRNRLCNDNCTL